MQEIIFLLIIGVFIGGMLWSDRDSRYELIEVCYDCGRMGWSQRLEPLPHEKKSNYNPFTLYMTETFNEIAPPNRRLFFNKSAEIITVDIMRGNNDTLDSFEYEAHPIGRGGKMM